MERLAKPINPYCINQLLKNNKKKCPQVQLMITSLKMCPHGAEPQIVGPQADTYFSNLVTTKLVDSNMLGDVPDFNRKQLDH